MRPARIPPSPYQPHNEVFVMSSERRHELQQNELAAYMGRLSKPIEKYGLAIGIGVAAIAAVMIALTLWSSTQTVARSDATFQLLEATGSNDAAQFESIADTYPGTPAASIARLYQADQLMSQGMEYLFQDRAEAEDQFNAAESAYRQALAGAGELAGSERILKSRANYGLARIAEAKGDVAAATKAYEAVVAANESDAMVETANNRIAALAKPGTQDFLAWFDQQDFSPAEPSLPPALPDESTLPDDPDMVVPDLGAGLGMDLEPDAKEETAADDTAADDTDVDDTDASPDSK